MDINEYISSGILELYVAGALSPDENRDVEEMASRHEEIRKEIEAILVAFEAIAAVPGMNPPPELRASILDQIGELERSTEDDSRPSMETAPAARGEDGASSAAKIGVNPEADSGAKNHAEIGGSAITTPRDPAVTTPRDPAAATPRHPAGSAPRATVIPLPARTRYLLAASIAVTIISSAAAGYFAYQWRASEQALAEANTENLRMTHDQNALKARLDKSSGDMAVLREHHNRVVEMKGMPRAPQALATVYWNPNTREVHLDKGTLPAPPPGKQYQLWAIADGKPVDAGMIPVDTTAGGLLESMQKIDHAEAFAVTLEPAGGSPAPTLDEMFVMGKLEG